MGLHQRDPQIKNANYRSVRIFTFETTGKAQFYALNYTSGLLSEIWVCHNGAAEDSGIPRCSRVSTGQWRILIRQSGLAERYNNAFYTNKIQKDATVYQKFLFHIYMKLNMFRATHRPSSGA